MAASRRSFRSVKVEAVLDEPLSRWLWLVKPILLLPHHFALIVLWILFLIASVIAFFAILVTERYPRTLFNFTEGVLRWTWRVAYYLGAMATDRYPPFSLGAVAGYPARLDIAYPDRLSRRLVLVKSWLLALPHYVVLGISPLIFYLVHSWGGVLWLLVAIGSVASLFVGPGMNLLFRGRYPSRVFGVLVGFDRWVLRVAAYVALMTDEYPPFHVDPGGTECVRA
jgi:uncharacterized protein DUF4389